MTTKSYGSCVTTWWNLATSAASLVCLDNLNFLSVLITVNVVRRACMYRDVHQKTCLPYKKCTPLYQKSTPRTKNMYQKHSAYQLLCTQFTSGVQRYVPEFCGPKIFFLYIADHVQLENGIWLGITQIFRFWKSFFHYKNRSNMLIYLR